LSFGVDTRVSSSILMTETSLVISRTMLSFTRCFRCGLVLMMYHDADVIFNNDVRPR
jgi:hypothetical protein